MAEAVQASSNSVGDLTAEHAMHLRDSAAKTLREAWSTPEQLGVGSDLHARCVRLLSEVRAYRTPPSDREASTVNPVTVNSHETLRLAWLAVSRSRDYSFFAMVARSKSWGSADEISGNTDYPGLREYGGVRWFPLHFPTYGEGGQSLDRPEVPQSQRWRFQQHADTIPRRSCSTGGRRFRTRTFRSSPGTGRFMSYSHPEIAVDALDRMIAKAPMQSRGVG